MVNYYCNRAVTSCRMLSSGWMLPEYVLEAEIKAFLSVFSSNLGTYILLLLYIYIYIFGAQLKDCEMIVSGIFNA